MRSKGSRFTLGVWGLRVCSLDVVQTFATVRNRPQPFATAPHPHEGHGRACMASSCKFCKRGHFWRFPASRSFVSEFARSDHWTQPWQCDSQKAYPLLAPSWDLGAPAPGAHGYFFSFFCKFDDRSLDFICRHARFYLDHKCEINSKRLDSPRSPQSYSLPKRTQGGVQPLDSTSFQFQVRPVDFIFWRLGLWMLFLSYVRLGTRYVSYFRMSAPFNLGPIYTFDWKGRNSNLDWWNWWKPCKIGIKL